MRKARTKKNLALYEDAEKRVEEGLRSDKKAYLADYYARKAGVSNAAVQLTIIVTFVINVVWQCTATLFLFPYLEKYYSTGADAAVPMAICVFLSALLILICLIVVFIVYSEEKHRQASLLMEEHILQEKGLTNRSFSPAPMGSSSELKLRLITLVSRLSR